MRIDLEETRLYATTTQIDDPGQLVDYLGVDGQAFMRGNDGFVTQGEVARLETDSMMEANEWWRAQSDLIDHESEMPGVYGTGPIAVGSFCFDPKHTVKKSVLIIPQVIVGRRNGNAWLTTIGKRRGTPELPPPESQPDRPQNVRFEPGAVSDEEWKSIVGDVISRIRQHDAEKVVCAREIVARADNRIDPRWVVRSLVASYGSCWNYLVDGFVGATPEMLVRREAGMTVSRVLAGTVQQVEGVSDAELAARLITSTKDLDEHRLAVESVIGGLEPHLQAVHVPGAPYVLTLPNVLHLATDICGVSYPDESVLQLAEAAHPSAAVCGTPTGVARDIIAAEERLDRGRFAGIVGWMDAQGDGEWALSLRCGQLGDDPHTMHLYAGAGIVLQSDPHAELVETEAKLAPMKSALRGVD